MKVWIDGRVVEGEEAHIPVTDHGLLYGDGVFEGIRAYGRRIFRLEDHLRRLQTAARSLGIELPGGIESIEKIVLETARANGRDDAYIRLIITRGSGELGVDPTTCREPRILCIADEVRLYPEEKRREGLAMVTSSLRKPPADALDPRIKSLNYLNSVLAKREARLQGADEALLLNMAGMVAEASVANIFVVSNGALTTPPTTDGALEGITRATVLELAEADGISVRVATLGRFDLFGADEIFLTGTGARLVSVATLDGQPIGRPGHHPMAERLSQAFSRCTRDRGTPF